MKVFIFVVSIPSRDFGQRQQGARATVIADTLEQARSQLDGLLPKAANMNLLEFRLAMLHAEPQSFDVQGYTELIMSDGKNTRSYLHANKAGSS
jgi:hypothetical protein